MPNGNKSFKKSSLQQHAKGIFLFVEINDINDTQVSCGDDGRDRKQHNENIFPQSPSELSEIVL